jgi:hypothetical protein
MIGPDLTFKPDKLVTKIGNGLNSCSAGHAMAPSAKKTGDAEHGEA